MRINTNIASLNATRNLQVTGSKLQDSVTKLSSGFRINRAADDAAGLGIANRLRADTRSMVQASANAEQANSLLQIAEGAASSVQSMLERIKELATQASSDTVDSTARARLNAEYVALKDEITRTVNTTKFQGRALVDGTFSSSVVTGAATSLGSQTGVSAGSVAISGAAAGLYTVTNTAAGSFTITNGSISQTVTGVSAANATVNFSALGVSFKTGNSYNAAAFGSTNLNSTNAIVSVLAGTGGEFLISSSGNYTTGNTGDYITVSNLDLTIATLGVGSLDLTTSASTARTALTTIDTAMSTVATALGSIGASQNRIENANETLKVAIQNFAAAESVIRDADMAEEMATFTKNSILAQAGTAMLAQANQLPQGILQLLRS